MNESPLQHALLVLFMVALILAGGLIQSGRAEAPSNAAEANAAPPVTLIASAVSSCNHAR